MERARRDDMLAKDRQRLGRELTAWLMARAAEHGPLGNYILPTKLGRLNVWYMVESGAIMCRFYEVERARDHFGVTHLYTGARLNPYSGKWNFHWSTRLTWREAFDAFMREVQPLIPCTCEAGGEIERGPWHAPSCDQYKA